MASVSCRYKRWFGWCENLVSLGLDEADAQRQNLDTYRKHFQTQFLEATDTYYRAESSAFVGSNSVADYMKKAEARLQEEADRVNLYLHDNTRNDVSTLDGAHFSVLTSL